MFSRFTNALYNAVDALAPPLPLQEDFIWHWKSITRFFTGKNASNSIPIEQTSIPGHLSEMLSILEQEENEIEIGNIGPCMEYIMQHRLLDTMCILASSDSPPGMKREMLVFITKLLNVVQHSLIPHVSMCMPILGFTALCGEVVAGPTEHEEMKFLECVCAKISDNPHLLNCFFITSNEPTPRHDCDALSDTERDENKEYRLISSLIELYKSPDNDISAKAGECVKSLCSYATDTIATIIAQCTILSKVLCNSTVTLYKAIPKTLKVRDLENPVDDDDDDNISISSDKRKYLCYLQQLHFIDSLVESAHTEIADHLSSQFHTDVLDAVLHPCLIDSDDKDLLFNTTLISCSLRTIKSTKLINVFGLFLLDDGGFDFSEPTVDTTKSILIERCRYSDVDFVLSLSNLQLFEELLLRPTKNILDNIALKHLENRSYYDFRASDSWLQFSDEDVCSRYSDDFSTETTPPNKTTPCYINRVIDAFIALIPDDLKSCESDEESGYETYIKEAHARFLKTLMISEHFDWPQNFLEKEEDCHLGPEDDSSSESQPEADSAHWTFYEGDFLHMIFDKLEQMLFQPYEINLQLTSIISRLVLFANPYLHEYFLNPLIPFVPGARSLFSVLFKISEDIQKEVLNIQGFKTKLKLTRNALLSDGNEYATFEESNVLEALIVLEEFCKELAAITFVKYHAVP